jgi:hypothetical protein
MLPMLEVHFLDGNIRRWELPVVLSEDNVLQETDIIVDLNENNDQACGLKVVSRHWEVDKDDSTSEGHTTQLITDWFAVVVELAEIEQIAYVQYEGMAIYERVNNNLVGLAKLNAVSRLYTDEDGTEPLYERIARVAGNMELARGYAHRAEDDKIACELGIDVELLIQAWDYILAKEQDTLEEGAIEKGGESNVLALTDGAMSESAEVDSIDDAVYDVDTGGDADGTDDEVDEEEFGDVDEDYSI